MNHVEVGKLLTLIAAIDNRDVNPMTIEMWQRIMADREYEEMAQAVPRYFAENDAYLSPRGLIAQAKKMKEASAEKLQHEKLQVESGGWRSDPEPRCKKHDLGITHCLECCKQIFLYADNMRSDERHRWALENIYA